MESTNWCSKDDTPTVHDHCHIGLHSERSNHEEKLNVVGQELILLASAPGTTTGSSRTNDDHGSAEMLEKKLRARRRNAMYSRRKYHRKKQVIERWKTTRMELLQKNQALRKSNEQLEAMIEHCRRDVAIRENNGGRLGKAAQRKRLHLSLLSSSPSKPPPPSAQMKTESQHVISNADAVPPMAPSRFSLVSKAMNESNPPFDLYHFPIRSGIHGSVRSVVPTSFSANVVPPMVQHDPLGSLSQQYLLAATTMTSPSSMSALLRNASVSVSSSLMTADVLSSTFCLHTPTFSSQLLQRQEVANLNRVFLPQSATFLRQNILDGKSGINLGINRSDLLYHNHIGSLNDQIQRHHVISSMPASASTAFVPTYFPQLVASLNFSNNIRL